MGPTWGHQFADGHAARKSAACKRPIDVRPTKAETREKHSVGIAAGRSQGGMDHNAKMPGNVGTQGARLILRSTREEGEWDTRHRCRGLSTTPSRRNVSCRATQKTGSNASTRCRAVGTDVRSNCDLNRSQIEQVAGSPAQPPPSPHPPPPNHLQNDQKTTNLHRAESAKNPQVPPGTAKKKRYFDTVCAFVKTPKRRYRVFLRKHGAKRPSVPKTPLEFITLHRNEKNGTETPPLLTQGRP